MKRNEPGLEILKGGGGRKEGIRDHEGWEFMFKQKRSYWFLGWGR